jgi:DNA mismatch repair ATPase MutS
MSIACRTSEAMLILHSIPAEYASFPISHQLFARVTMDDNIEANVSTFASEMRETAFILRNVEKGGLSVVLIGSTNRTCCVYPSV